MSATRKRKNLKTCARDDSNEEQKYEIAVGEDK